MWSLPFYNPSEAKSRRVSLIAPDDVVFTAVMKRGPTVHLKLSQVRCFHVAAESDGLHLGLGMSILEATSISNRYAFHEGVMGKWKLITPAEEGSVPSITLLSIFENANDFLSEVIQDSNPSWARKPYLDL
jgi:hypothetical protein